MNTDIIWAKSKAPDAPTHPSMFLLGHLADVHASALHVCDTTSDDQLRAFGLDPERYRQRFRRCVTLSALLHDLGKANDHFQGMILGWREPRQNPQGLRHEWVTLLMLSRLRDWLFAGRDGNDLDRRVVEWAIVGHHPSCSHASPPRSACEGSGPQLIMLLDHPGFQEILVWLGSTLGLGEPPRLARVQTSLIGLNSVLGEIAAWAREAGRRWKKLTDDSSERKFIAAVKACLIAADVAGSALPRVKSDDPEPWSWIDRSFAATPDPGDLERVASRKLGGAAPREFQNDVARSGSGVTYVKAGCGSGKTVAAYLWAARNHPRRRLYFCYPTTGTATEGFKDYLYEPDGELEGIGARLFHSRRDIDYEIILRTGSDTESDDLDASSRLESLEAWSTPVVACTVDNVLGLLQNNRRGLFAWPALTQAAFVFDEIHAYDDQLFGNLLRFLKDLPGLPVLLMTASLPQSREEVLRRLLRQHRGIDLAPISGPIELEDRPRYHMELPHDDPLSLIHRELAQGGKVLWVCNTVKRSMTAFDSAIAAGLHPLAYHSRFKYIDRVNRHRGVVEAFTPEFTDPALAICTQVCEMSLDLKGCTFLVTELAPVPALIQRLGRLNRHAREGDPTCPFLVIEPEQPEPYTPADLDVARAWLAKLPRESISQRLLAETWEHDSGTPTFPAPSAWLDGGPVTTVCELRAGSPGITVLMAEDLARIHSSRDVLRYTLPMPPRRRDWASRPSHRGVPVAETGSIHYDPLRGAEWAR